MIQLLYLSGASRQYSPDDIEDILSVSRANNERDGITGVLLWADGAFIQILEGETSAVRRTFDRIRADSRHRNVMPMFEQEVSERAFRDWSMGFKSLDPSEAAHERVFKTTHAALANRIDTGDGGMMLNLILAFGRDFMSLPANAGESKRPER